MIDLHVHSNKSDGSLPPGELMKYALEKGLNTIALTDHDTVDGIPEAMAAIRGTSLKLIPGIEFSTEYRGRDIHILGLYVDTENQYFKERLKAFVNGRTVRNEEMCRRLQSHGIPVSYHELTAAYPESVITRAHFAKFMLSRGYVTSLKEAFDKYIGDRCPCFVPRRKVTPARAIEIITKADGIPILAHPFLYQMGDEQLEALISELTRTGLAGIEAIYSSHTPSQERKLKQWAAQYGLCFSGGTDYHGTAKPGLDLATGYGSFCVPDEVRKELDRVHEERKGNSRKYLKSKILFTDLDGTLLDHNKKVSDYTKEILKKWTEAGHRLVLSSGRDINSVKKVQEDLCLHYPGMFLAGYNGGQVYDCDAQKLIYETGLPIETVRKIMELAKRYGIYCHTYSQTHIISPGECEALTYYRRHIHTPVLFSEDVTKLLTASAGKCIAIELENRELIDAFKAEAETLLGDEVTLLYSNEYYLELFPSDSGKGNCVRTLCKLLTIPLMLSVAAGDNHNDLSMIEAAGMGIAMKNATDDIKDAANIITEFDNDHDGLARALLSFI